MCENSLAYAAGFEIQEVRIQSRITGNKRREHLSYSGECSPTVHDHEIVDQRNVASPPGNIERQFFGQLRRKCHTVAIQWTAIPQRDRFRRIVATVSPTLVGGDQLVEK